ncbi:hypothetical protein F5Y14DRAFT_427021 [Nemania sp. NC0429]|nr:hypothetical protein F5Y14DRAFT_427021 [Nemania sp. NC0429]
MITMLETVSPSRSTSEEVESRAAGRGDETRAGKGTESAARELISTSVILARETPVGAPVSLVEGRPASVNQNGWPRQGGPSEDQRPRPWDRHPATFIAVTATVTDMKPPHTTDTFPSSEPSSTASRSLAGGNNISGPMAAGLGAASSVVLFGIGIAVVLFRKKGSRLCWGQSSAGKASGNEEQISDIAWPPYHYSASNDDSPFELSAICQPKEMCAETKPQEKDASDHSGVAEFDG